jgi:hypothetical protein
MKEEVAQHCVRLLDARDTLRGHYDRDYQLRAMGYFILVAKFHNRIQVKVKRKMNFFGSIKYLLFSLKNILVIQLMHLIHVILVI